MSTPDKDDLPVRAYVWHQHLGEKSMSLRWDTPNQFEYTMEVDELCDRATALAQIAELRERLEKAERDAARYVHLVETCNVAFEPSET